MRQESLFPKSSGKHPTPVECVHILTLKLDSFSLNTIESVVKVESLCIFPLNILSRILPTTPTEKVKGRLLHLAQGGKTESAMQTIKICIMV